MSFSFHFCCQHPRSEHNQLLLRLLKKLLKLSLSLQMQWRSFLNSSLQLKSPFNSIYSFLNATDSSGSLWAYRLVVCVCACPAASLQSAALCTSIDCSPPGSTVHRIVQARILEWVAITFSRRSSQPRDRTWDSCIAGRFFTIVWLCVYNYSLSAWKSNGQLKLHWTDQDQDCSSYHPRSSHNPLIFHLPHFNKSQLHPSRTQARNLEAFPDSLFSYV